MRRHSWLLFLLLAGCGGSEAELVRISPTWGWVDGCTEFELGGRGLESGELRFGTEPAAELEWAEGSAGGSYVRGLSPPAGAAGPVDVELISETLSLRLDGAYEYLDCPNTLWLDAISDGEDGRIQGGESLWLRGCGLVQGLELWVGEVFAGALTPSCETAVAEATAPDLDDGIYPIRITDAQGSVLWSTGCEGCIELSLRYGEWWPEDTGAGGGDTGSPDTGTGKGKGSGTPADSGGA